MLWFSELLRTPIDEDQQEIGKVQDIVLRLEESGFPTLTGILVYIEDMPIFIPTHAIRELTPERIITSKTLNQFSPFERRTGEVLIGRDLLDHHLIWTRPRHRPRLVMARDSAFINNGGWKAVGIDATSHRLGLRLFSKHSSPDRQVVDWRELLPLVGHVPTARRRLELGKIRKLHPAQLADLLEQASEDEGKEIFGALQADPEFEADVVEEMEPNRRREALREKTDNELGELLGTMEPDDAVDMLLSLDQDRRENVLALIPKPQQKDVKRLLLYHPDTAGGIMTTDFITVRSSDTVEACCEALRLKPELPGNLWSIFVIDSQRRLIGQLPLACLITAPPETIVTALIADMNPATVSPDADLTDIAVTMADYNLAALAVLDSSEHILGVVTVDDVLSRTIPANWRRRKEALDEG